MLYFFQETSCKGKSLECHPAYHAAATFPAGFREGVGDRERQFEDD